MSHAVRDYGFRYWLRLVYHTAQHYRGRALIRAFWLALVGGYYGELCEDCGNRYDGTIWWCTDNALWRSVSGKATSGLLCPRCFDLRADRAGLSLVWEPRVRESAVNTTVNGIG